MITNKEINLTTNLETKNVGRLSRKPITVNNFFINGLTICFTESGGSAMFCTIDKNGSPSNIRTKSKNVFKTTWDRLNLRNFLLAEDVKTRSGEVFADIYPDTTWGDAGSILNKKEVLNRFYSEYQNLYNVEIKLSNLFEGDNLDNFNKRFKSSIYVKTCNISLILNLIFAKKLMVEKNIETFDLVNHKENKKDLINECITHFSIMKKFFNYNDEDILILEKAFKTPEVKEQIINKLLN